MTRILTVVGIALAALAIAPTAFGEGRLAPLFPPNQVATYQEPRGHPPARASMLDLASAAGRVHLSAVRDAFTPVGHPPPYRAAGPHRGWTATPPLAANPTYTTNPGTSARAKLAATRAQARLFSIDTKPESTTSGSDIAWSQIGIGFAIGMALAIGLALGVRAVRARPFAH